MPFGMTAQEQRGMRMDEIPPEVRAYIREHIRQIFNRPVIVVLVHGHPDVFPLELFEQISRNNNRVRVKQRYMISGITAHELGDTLQELRAKVSAQRADGWFEWEKPRTWHTPNHTRTWYTQMLAKSVCNPLSEEDWKRRMSWEPK